MAVSLLGQSMYRRWDLGAFVHHMLRMVVYAVGCLLVVFGYG